MHGWDLQPEETVGRITDDDRIQRRHGVTRREYGYGRRKDARQIIDYCASDQGMR